MYFYQRAFRYITRKKSKSLLLFLCLFIISTMVLCGTMVLQTAQATSRSMWEKTGTKIVLKDQRGENKIQTELCSQILELPNVSKINRAASHTAYSGNFTPVIVKDDESDLNASVTLQAYDNTETDGSFAEEKYRLLDGNPIQEEHSGILVNSLLAELNGFQIGDQLTFAAENGSTATGEITGIFFSGMERKQDASIVSAYRIENQIFVDHALFETLYGEEGYSSIAVYTDNPENLSSLRQQIEPFVAGEDIDISTSDLLYQQMQAPLEQVIRISSLTLVLIIITAVIVISLLLCMWMRTRTKEMAVFISLGISKGSLFLQAMTESFSLFALSVIGAVVISSLFAGQLMHSLFETYELAVIANTGLSGTHLLTLLLLGSVIVFIAVGISIVPILRANPRDTLSKMEG